MVILFYLYLVAALAIGCLCARKIRTPDDYYVAGRQAGVLFVTGSLLATILGCSAILGSIDFAYAKGWAGAWFMLCAAIGLMALLPFVGRLSAFRGYNLPTLLGGFYGPVAQKLSAGVIALAWLGVVGAQVIGAAKITSSMFGLPYTWAAVAIGVTFTAYTAAGGQLSIIRTDLIQAILIFAGLLMVFGVLLFRSPSLSGQPLLSSAFTPFDLLMMLCTYSSTYLVGPDIYSRLFCARDTGTARKAVATAAITLIPMAFLLAFIGVYGSRGYVRSGESTLFAIVKGEFSPAVTLLLYFTLLSAIMSSADTTLFTAGSLLSQFLRERMDSSESVKTTRACTVVLGALAILTALRCQSILTALLFALGIYAGAFVVPVLWGMFGLRSDRRYAVAAIVAGGGLALAGKIQSAHAIGNILVLLAFPVNLALLALGLLPCRLRPKGGAEE
ncbi:MAG: sodium:solute symporter family protein [Victivallales bacterium]|nr:sodium:solute symporter family protein [Victivallales bacterium]